MTKEFLLLTGSTGFIGSKLQAKLLKSKINIISIHKKNFSLNNKNKTKNHLRFKYNTKNLHYIFSTFNIKLIIHLAVQYDKSQNRLINLYKSNVIFPSEILKYALKYNVKYFINTDTFYNKYRDHYSLTKKHFREILFYNRKKINVLNLQLAHVYGPDDNKNKFLPTTIHKMSKNLKINILNPNTQIDFIYIDDVINAYMKILKNINIIEKDFTSIYVGSNKKISLRSFLLNLKKQYISLFPNNKSNFLYKINTIKKTNMTIKQDIILKKLNWKSSVILSSGLKKTILFEKKI